MTTASFEQALRDLAQRMRRGAVHVPRSAQWRIEPGSSPVVVATMQASDLSGNIQVDSAAVPSFALCLAWWLEHFKLLGPGKVRARVEVVGDKPLGEHAQRSMFLLHEYELLLPERFTCVPKLEMQWPLRPLVNESASAREASTALKDSNGEHAIECAFTLHPQVAEQFAAIEPINGFRRQLPVGIFDGKISKSSRWSPGGKSQIDLWAMSADRETAHLFELKILGNTKLGILPEAFWYARLLHRIRIGDFGGRPVDGGGPNIDCIRNAKRITMWLLVARVHPLVEHEGRSPLEWFRAALVGSGLDFGILPFEGHGDCLRLRTDLRWPADPSSAAVVL